MSYSSSRTHEPKCNAINPLIATQTDLVSGKPYNSYVLFTAKSVKASMVRAGDPKFMRKLPSSLSHSLWMPSGDVHL
jgi:hypothetical protein